MGCRHRPFAPSLVLLIACSGLIACLDEPSPDASRVAITVAPLELPGISDASYALTVTNSADEVVWTRTVTSSAYGDGAGSLSYVGPCDADASPNEVALELLSLTGTGGPLTAGSDFANPAPSGDPVVLSVTCEANRDVPVSFDLTVARAASQGFFDVGVEFSDIFCSAKLDCESAPGQPLKLLSNPATGARDQTAVLGFACTAGAGQDTWLHMSAVEISCAGGHTFTVDPAAGPGQLNPTFTGAADELLFQAAIYQGEEQFAGFTKGYWNVALGLASTGYSTLGPCTLTARATATDGQLSGGATPVGTRYPYVDWSVELVDDGGARSCTSHGLTEGTGVEVVYSDVTGVSFAASWPVANACGDGTCSADELCGCPADCAGEACDDGDADTSGDACQADGSCVGIACTGSEGDFAPTVDATLSGAHTFTTFTIPDGVTISGSGSAPLEITVCGEAQIAGTLTVSGQPGAFWSTSSTPQGGAACCGGGRGGNGSSYYGPAPSGTGSGGGAGGRSGNQSPYVNGGNGGGGGYATAGYAGFHGGTGASGGAGGGTYGDAAISSLLGGSGGGGGSGGIGGNNTHFYGAGGGAGGGVIALESYVGITVQATGAVLADGGKGGASQNVGAAGGGGAGSGGAIVLRAPTVTNAGLVSAVGGDCTAINGASATDGDGGDGRIRVDTTAGTAPAGTFLPSVGYTTTYP